MGKKQKKKRRQVSRDMSTDDDDDEFMRDLDEAEEESLHWSSPATSSVGEEDEDRSTEEYRATGRNAQRSAALKGQSLIAFSDFCIKSQSLCIVTPCCGDIFGRM